MKAEDKIKELYTKAKTEATSNTRRVSVEETINGVRFTARALFLNPGTRCTWFVNGAPTSRTSATEAMAAALKPSRQTFHTRPNEPRVAFFVKKLRSGRVAIKRRGATQTNSRNILTTSLISDTTGGVK